jgi:NADPH:quinone reductase-like Zn-dependent oxidoreductase
MKQILIPKYGSADVLVCRDVAFHPPQPGELQIGVKAAGLNFADILARQGLYPDAPKPPCVVGYEIAGVVQAVGDTVAADWVGKEVVALTRFGGQSEYVNVPVEQVFSKPAQLDFTEAATLPVNYLTAFQLIVVMGSLQKDETVLIHNAGGGVGLAAVDIARHIGARILGTASLRKHDLLRERGVDLPIDYRQADWVDAVLQETNGSGVEMILDPLGGEHWKKSLKCLRSTGRLGMFGVSSLSGNGLKGKLSALKLLFQMPWFGPIALMNQNRGVYGVNLGHLWHERNKVRVWMQELLQGVRQGWIRPYVDKTFSFDQIQDAHRYLENRQNIGKCILVP